MAGEGWRVVYGVGESHTAGTNRPVWLNSRRRSVNEAGLPQRLALGRIRQSLGTVTPGGENGWWGGGRIYPIDR